MNLRDFHFLFGEKKIETGNSEITLKNIK